MNMFYKSALFFLAMLASTMTSASDQSTGLFRSPIMLAANSQNNHAIADNVQKAANTPLTAKEATTLPTYIPPMRGAPKRRVGGGTRGTAVDLTLNVLAPEHTGLTSSPQPTLYFYISSVSSTPMELVITEEQSEDPVFESRFTVNQAGIYSIDISRANINLKPDTEYQWFVAIVIDPKHRSRDIISGAAIKYINPETPITQNNMNAEKSAEAYAASGYWYDAFSILSKSLSGENSATFTEAQKSLLQQVGLDILLQSNNQMFSAL
ncbi:MAG: DUF928 domain-containing protein [Gammaproteobacteria bacterium]|nr:DUF928 domain-containing protein [Gammaproteobacteria bacterium]